jgi:hypothetical protein
MMYIVTIYLFKIHLVFASIYFRISKLTVHNKYNIKHIYYAQ